MTTPASQPKLPDDYAVVLVQAPPLHVDMYEPVDTPAVNEALRPRLLRALDRVFEEHGELVLVDPKLLPIELSPTFADWSYHRHARLLEHVSLDAMAWAQSRGLMSMPTNELMHRAVIGARRAIVVTWPDGTPEGSAEAITRATRLCRLFPLYPTTKWTTHDAT